MTAYHNWTHRPRSRGGTDPLEFGGHGPWIEPELVNGYTDTTGAPDTFAYRHAPGSPDDAWEIEFRGHIEGPSGTYAFVLPTEDRPLSDKYGITEGEDADTDVGIVVEWYIEQATGYVFFTYPISGGGGGGGSSALDDLTDVDTSGVADGDALIYDSGSSTWVPGSGGGGGSGTDPYLTQVQAAWGWTAVSDSFATNADSNQILGGGHYVFNSAGAINAEITYPVVLAAGTYRLDVGFVKVNTGGIITFTLDGGSSLGTIDTYNGSTSYNQTGALTGIAVGSGGLHTLSLKSSTKNGSSSAYKMFISFLSLKRTGA